MIYGRIPEMPSTDTPVLPAVRLHAVGDLISHPPGEHGAALPPDPAVIEQNLTIVPIGVDDALILAVRGGLWSGSRAELAAALDWAFAGQPQQVVIDGSGITRCDRAGLTPIVDAADRGPHRGIRVAMSGLDHRHQRLLPASCTDDLFYPTLRSALTAISHHCSPVPDVRHRADLLAEIDALRGIVASMPVIEQAKGAIMLSHGVPTDAAFALLRWISQQHNIKIRDLAARLTTTIAARSPDTDARSLMDRLLTDLIAHPDLPGTRPGCSAPTGEPLSPGG